ncbi:MAG: CDP-alcohol phosphatidyltransferase family protein [Actinobacteria bacterium]|nr:CDP-alcohol phosphatidyltransferase family protein [Actinomycetota bacterium]
MSSALARSRKARAGTDWICELVFRPLAHLVVLALAPLRVPPPAVVLASGVAGIAGAVELARGHLVVAALLVQLKTILDNADGQLARLTGRVTAFGRYLDSEMDLVVDAALFAGLGWWSGNAAAALVGFLALTTVLNVNFNVERLYRGGGPASPDGPGRPTAALRRVYALLYAPQDRLVERYAEWRLRGRSEAERAAWHDRGTVAVLANLGMSPQLLVLGALTAAGHPLVYVWVVLAQLGLVAALALRREALVRGSFTREQEVT